MKKICTASSFILGFVWVTLTWGASFTDSSGWLVEVDRPFTRIISLYSAHTENLADLGVDGELIGISTSDSYPARIMGRQRFSYREDPEKFLAVRPDLVLVRPMIVRSYPQLLDKLKQAGITVVSLQPTSVEGVYDYWRALGILSGRTEEAEAMIRNLQESLVAISGRVAMIPADRRVRVYFESIHKKMKTFAPQSIAIFALEQAGGINVAWDAVRVRQTNIAAYGKERILAKAGEIDLYLAQQGRMNPVSIDMIQNEPGFEAVKAVRDDRIFLVDEQLVSRPTMRMLDGIGSIAAILYPDYFPIVSGDKWHDR